ncbi:hypothetical protein TYRP_011505 [Tyrophagus putrescentiae]|nr:hypothetical protein TYRP_011505 [Tyrophagus putrescentiae]
MSPGWRVALASPGDCATQTRPLTAPTVTGVPLITTTSTASSVLLGVTISLLLGSLSRHQLGNVPDRLSNLVVVTPDGVQWRLHLGQQLVDCFRLKGRPVLHRFILIHPGKALFVLNGQGDFPQSSGHLGADDIITVRQQQIVIRLCSVSVSGALQRLHQQHRLGN